MWIDAPVGRPHGPRIAPHGGHRQLPGLIGSHGEINEGGTNQAIRSALQGGVGISVPTGFVPIRDQFCSCRSARIRQNVLSRGSTSINVRASLNSRQKTKMFHALVGGAEAGTRQPDRAVRTTLRAASGAADHRTGEGLYVATVNLAVLVHVGTATVVNQGIAQGAINESRNVRQRD